MRRLLGFAPGTDGFANCMMRTVQQRQAQQDAANKAASEKSYQDWLTLSGHGQQDLPSMTPGAEPDPGQPPTASRIPGMVCDGADATCDAR